MASKTTHREERRWRRWRGSREDIEAILNLTMRTVVRAAPDEKAPYRMYGSIAFEDRDHDLNSIGDVSRAIKSAEFPQFRSLSMFFGKPEMGVQAHVGFHQGVQGSAVSLSVYGSSMSVSGVAKEIARRIDAGKRAFNVQLRPLWLAIIAVWLALIGAGLGVATDSATVVYVFGALSVLGLLGSAFMQWAFPALVPHFELLPAGTTETRAARWRKRGGRLALFLGGAVASAVIYALVDKVL